MRRTLQENPLRADQSAKENTFLHWIGLCIVLVNLAAAGAATVLLNRISNRRIRYLVVIMGVLAFSQTSSLITVFENDNWSRSIWSGQQLIVTWATVTGLYLLFREMTDRNRTDRILRLTEHENQVMQGRLERRTPARTGEAQALQQPSTELPAQGT